MSEVFGERALAEDLTALAVYGLVELRYDDVGEIRVDPEPTGGPS